MGWASCSEDIDYDTITSGTDGEVGGEVVVDVAVASSMYLSAYTRSNPVGDSAAQTIFSSGDKIAIATTQNEGAPTEDYNTYTYDGTVWKSNGSDYLTWGETFPQYFYAYYPVNDTTSYEAFTLPTDQSTLKKMATADYMRGEMEVSSRPTNGKLTLEMERQTAKIKVRINGFSNQFSETPTISDLTIYSRYSEVSSDAAEDITPIKVYIEQSSSQEDSVYYALVAPNAKSDTLMVDTVNNKYSIPHPLISLKVTFGEKQDTTTTLTVTPNNVYPELKAGYCYQYLLNVGKDSIAVAATVAEWADTDTIVDSSERVAYLDCQDEDGNDTDLTQAWLSENITMKETTLYVVGNFTTSQLDTLRTWLAEDGGAGSDAQLTLDLTAITGDVPSTTVAYYYFNEYYPNVSPEQQSVERDMYDAITGLVKVVLPSTDEDSESSARQTTRSSGGGVALGNYAFYGCRNLKEIENHENIVSMGAWAITFCKSLTTLNLSSLKYTGDYAMACCERLVDLKIPQLDSLKRMVFYGNSSLTKVDLTNVKYLDYGTFKFCTSLEEAVLPNATVIFGSNFANCFNLKYADISGVEYIYNATNFENCISLERVKWSSNIGQYVNESAMTINVSTFKNCHALKTLENFDIVTTIQQEAFYGCNSLEELPECFTKNVTSIDDEAFYNCWSLTSVNLPNITEIPDGAFSGCTGLTSYQFGDITAIGAQAFENCTALPKADFPYATSLGYSSFKGCTSLKAIDFPSATSVGRSAFENCTGIKEASLTACTDFYVRYVFSGCTSLERVHMGPGGDENERDNMFGPYYFQNCTSLKQIDLTRCTQHGRVPACAYVDEWDEDDVGSDGSYLFAPFYAGAKYWRTLRNSQSDQNYANPTAYDTGNGPEDVTCPTFKGCETDQIYLYVYGEAMKDSLDYQFSKDSIQNESLVKYIDKTYEAANYIWAKNTSNIDTYYTSETCGVFYNWGYNGFTDKSHIIVATKPEDD